MCLSANFIHLRNFCRKYFKLKTFNNYDDMIGVTHNMETINKLRLVYPSPKDIELFPGGKQPFHVESYYFCSHSINVMSLYLTTKTKQQNGISDVIELPLPIYQAK